MDQQAPLNLPFVRVFGHGQKIEVVWIFQNLFSQIGTGRGERALEIGQRLPFPLMQPTGNLEYENVPAPAVFERGAEIPFTRGTVLDSVENADIVAPGQFCNELLQNLRLGPSFGQGAHIAEIARAEALDAGKLVLQIVGQPVHNLAAPALAPESFADVLANRPIEQDQFMADRLGGANLGGVDAGLQLLKEFGVTGGCLKSVCHLDTQFIRRRHSPQRQ